MLHGIDISNWQKGFNIPEGVDFCIVKATEGTTFVDKYCDGFIQQCKRKGILYGFYHFMTSANPESQAAFFAEKTSGYSLEGIPVIDIESERINDWGEYGQRFVDKYHAITDVYPIVYCSAGALERFSGYPLVDTCGLWVAGYPSNKEYGLKDVPKFPYSVSPWKFAAMWQFTDNGWFTNWDEGIDLDVAYMDADAWKLYANPNVINNTAIMPTPVPSENQNKTHTFENSVLRVDITLK